MSNLGSESEVFDLEKGQGSDPETPSASATVERAAAAAGLTDPRKARLVNFAVVRWLNSAVLQLGRAYSMSAAQFMVGRRREPLSDGRIAQEISPSSNPTNCNDKDTVRLSFPDPAAVALDCSPRRTPRLLRHSDQASLPSSGEIHPDLLISSFAGRIHMEGPSSNLPFLVHDVGSEYVEPQSQYSIASRSLVNATIDLLQDYRCFETPQGWILALDPASLQTFLWRPQDSKRITLPPMDVDIPINCKCLLSDKPSAALCVVMVLNLDDFDYWVCQIGGSKWEHHGYKLTMYNAKDQPVERHMARRRGIAAVGGKVYYEFTGNELGFVEFHPADDEPNLGLIEVDMVNTPDSMPMWSSYLVESCSQLFLVVVFFDGQKLYKIAEVAVYKMDFSRPAWCKVDRIGDRVFLLGGDRMGASKFGASCSASEHGLSGNCIYFLNHIATNENFLHIIDLEKGTKEVQRPFKDFVDSLRPPFWMLPTD